MPGSAAVGSAATGWPAAGPRAYFPTRWRRSAPGPGSAYGYC